MIEIDEIGRFGGSMKLEAGQDIDLLIAEHLFGFHLGVRDYSTKLESAVEVAEKLREMGWLVVMKWMPRDFYFTTGVSLSELDIPQPPPENILKGETVVELKWVSREQLLPTPLVHAETPALAICRAAIEAVVALRMAKQKKEVVKT